MAPDALRESGEEEVVVSAPCVLFLVVNIVGVTVSAMPTVT